MTNLQSISIDGTVTDLTTVSLTVNGNPVTPGNNGSFSTPVTLTEGLNTVTLIASDAAGNNTTISRSVILDSEAPAVDLISPVDSTITNLSSIIVSGKITDANFSLLTIGGNAVTVSADGSFSTTVNLVEGLNSVVLTAKDKAGNTTTVSRSLIRDSQAPIVTITSPNDSLITKLQSIKVNGTIVDANFASLKINNTSITIDSTGAFSSQLNLNEGVNTISLIASDKAGNSTTMTRLAILDTQPPTVHLTSPVDSLITKQQNIDVSGTCVDSSAVTLIINGNSVPIGVGGAFSYQSPTIEGKNSITVVAADAAGNSTTISRLVIRDSQPPVVTLQSPMDSLVTNQASITVSGKVSDSTQVQLTVNGQTLSANSDGTFSTTINLIEGKNAATLIATDAAGNQTTISRVIIRDTQAPVVTLQAPIDSLITNQTSITVSGKVSDSTNVQLTVNGQSLSANPDGTFSTIINLVEGKNIITISATDAAGNQTTIARIIQRDSQPPVLTISSPADSLITNQSTVTMIGTATDSTAFTMTINGTPVTIGTGGSFSAPISLVQGTNIITLKATDAAGNITTSPRTIFLDTLPPVIALTAPTDSLITNKPSISVSGTVNDQTATSLKINGNAVVLGAGGTFSTTVSLVEGMNTITVIAKDGAGNSSTITRALRLDTQSPTLTITSPNNNFVTTQQSVTITGTVLDSTLSSLTINGTTVTANGNGQFTASVNLQEGNNSITLLATDGAGNSTTVLRTVRLDTAPPALVLTSPIDSAVTNKTKIVISGSITDSSSIIFTINGIAFPVSTNGSFSDTLSINEGKNYFNIVATDTAGNQTTLKRVVIRDTQSPTILIASPKPNAATTENLISVIGSVIDSTQISITINGVVQTADVNGGFTSSLFLSNGNNTIIAAATDQAGNTSTVTRIISKVPLPPDPVTVAPTLDTTVATLVMDATTFIYSGSNPIQKGVTTGAINKTQVTVLRGRVLAPINSGLDNLPQPLPGAKITILGKPEFGYTFSREDGMYDIAVNGGGEVKVNFDKPGYLPAMRQVTTSWATYSSVDDVVLMQMDTVVHKVDFTQPAVVQGTPATDSLGTRRPSLFFKQGTQAKLVFTAYNYKVIFGCSSPRYFPNNPIPDKIISIPIDSLVNVKSVNVRAKEYTVGPNAELLIPANLPQSVAYTFVVELTADEMLSAGAKDVRFNQTAVLYLENVMKFPVGLTVPIGCYNREKGFWETSDNGRVIKILSTSGGVAAIDYNGDGVAEPADTLIVNGISLVEQQYLAGTYSAGQSLWRAEITHLGTYAGGFGMITPNAAYPQNPLPDRYAKVDRDNIVAGSVIGVQNQTLGESIPITNTPMTMSYKSDRVFGRREAYCLDIPLTGKTIPQGMSRITLEIEIVGNTYDFEFAPQANLTYHFEWDGKDAYGRRVQGQQNILTTISYCYPAQYTLPPDVKKCFATPSGQIMEQYIASRKETKRTQIWEGKIGAFDILSLGIGGWSLSLHHGYDCVGRILYKGTGEVRSASVMDNVINTIAGSPNGFGNLCNMNFEGVQAIKSMLPNPIDSWGSMQFGYDGSLFYSAGARIDKIDTAGIMSTVAGLTGGCSNGIGDTTTGIMANCAVLSHSARIAQGSDKYWYCSDMSNNVVWRISPEGEFTRFAGIHYDDPYGNLGKFGGDGGLALNAYLNRPGPIAFGKDGCLYVGDTYNYRIRKISPDGIITTVAGTGGRGYSGDGGPATKAMMGEPRGLTIGPDGSIYLCDYQNHRIRRITPDGIINTFAGNGFGDNNTGDGGPALQARLRYPSDISISKDGTVFLNSWERVRGVATDGYIKTIVGGGNTFWVDNGPATSTAIGTEPKITFGPDGNLYVSDWPFLGGAPSSINGPRIFKVAPPLPGISLSEILIASEDGSERYVFTYSGRHLRTLDALTGVVKYSFGYDSNYRLVTITDVDSLVTQVERDSSGKATAIVSPYGVRTQLNLDSLGYLLQATNPASESNIFTYTTGGLMTSKTDARGNSYNYSYDSLGYLTKDLDPVGGYTNLTRIYDSTGYTVTAVTAMGKKTTYRSEKAPDGTRRFYNIDPNGLKTITVDSTDGSSYTITPDGMNTPLTEKPDPRFGMQSPLVNATTKTPGGIQSNVNQFRTVTQMTGTAVTGLQDSISVNGKPVKVAYDGNARILTKTSAEGRKTFSFFDVKGRIVKDSIPGILATTYKYDNKGRKIENNQGGRKTTYEYDSLGRQAKVIDTYGHITQFIYDAGDRLLKTILPDLSEVSFTYDKNGNMLSLTPPGKPEHTFDYSKVDLETLYTPPFAGDSARATARIYTLDKEDWKILRPDSLNIMMEYGGKGSLSGVPKKIYFDRGFLTNLADTLKGQQIGVVSAEGDSLKFLYDGTLVKKVTWIPTSVDKNVKGSVAFTYNSDQQVTTETIFPAIGSADSVILKYDKDGLLTSIGVMRLRYGVNNTLLLSDSVGNIITNYTYDTFSALASKEVKSGSSILFRVDYMRDSLSKITEKTEIELGISTKYDYIYDVIGRLVQVKKNDTLSAAYYYDLNGNRLMKFTSMDTLRGAYDAQDRLLDYSSTRYFYTKNGDLTMKVDTSKGDTTRYSYDAFGSLRSVTLPNGTLIEYLIDGLGHRVGRKINGTLTQKWLYSSDLRIIAELDSSNKTISRYVYTSSENVPEYLVKSDTVYRMVTDHLGSVRQIVNTQTKLVVQQIKYDEYGNVISDSNPGFTPFGYAGGLYDVQTELLRFGIRDYNTAIGRWTQKDPIRFAAKDGNLYGYVFDSPINFIDVSGRAGAGFIGQGSFDIGLGVTGAGAQYSEGWGLFASGEKGASIGNFYSSGIWGGGQGEGGSPNYVIGMSSGIAMGYFQTSASSVEDLEGSSSTFSISFLDFTMSVSQRGKTVTASYLFSTFDSPGGGSVSNYTTNTHAVK